MRSVIQRLQWVDSFIRSRFHGKSLPKAYYNKRYLEDLINNTGWMLISYERPVRYMMHSLQLLLRSMIFWEANLFKQP